MPQAPIRSCAIPVRTAAPLQKVPHEKKGSKNRAFERAAESARMRKMLAAGKCFLDEKEYLLSVCLSSTFIYLLFSAFHLRKTSAERDPGVSLLDMLASLTQWRISISAANRMRAFCPGPWPTHESARTLNGWPAALRSGASAVERQREARLPSFLGGRRCFTSSSGGSPSRGPCSSRTGASRGAGR